MPSLRDAVQETTTATSAVALGATEPQPAKKAVNGQIAAASVMETAFLQARVVDEAGARDVKDRDLARNARLAKMQRELASL
jgi:hypothetical protein